MPEPTPRMVKADFITGVVLFLLGIYMVTEGLRMPGAGGYIEAGGEPGRVPVMLGAIISLLALLLLIRSMRAGGHRLTTADGSHTVDRTGAARGILTAVWCSCYALAMLGFEFADWRLSYQVATTLFLLVFIIGFEWGNARELGARRWSWLQARLPSVARWVQPLSRVIHAASASYLWLICTATVQAFFVTWAIAWLFEQKFYVQLP